MPGRDFDSLRRDATVALLVQWQRAYNIRATWQKYKEHADAQIADQDARMGDAGAGLRALGFDIYTEGVWQRLGEEFGAEVLRLAAEPQQAPQPQLFSDEDFSQVEIEAPEPAPAAQTSMPKIWKIVRDRLREAGERGTKAAAIRDYIRRTYGREVHEKTVGMTLYRLSQQSPPSARREGHTWFFVPPSADAKNPGADDAGAQVVALEERRMRDVASRP